MGITTIAPRDRDPWSLFSEPDTLLASQIPRRHRGLADSSWGKLACATMEDAFDVIVDLHGVRGRGTRWPVLLEEAVAWFFSTERDYCFSFLAICDHLGLSADAIRREVKAKLGDRE